MNTSFKFMHLVPMSIFLMSSTDATADPSPITSTFQVQITITKTCTMTSGSAVSFGNVVANVVPAKATANLSVTCSKGTPFTIGLQPSNGNQSGAGSMSGTGSNPDKVAYQLYTDASGSTVWGSNTTTGPNLLAGSGQGAPQAVPVYAGITNTNVMPDNYSDTVTVTFTY